MDAPCINSEKATRRETKPKGGKAERKTKTNERTNKEKEVKPW
jgi:hypothetical protein